MGQSYVHCLKHGNKALHQQLIDLSLGFFDVNTLGVRTSYVDPQTDDQTRGLSP